MLSKSGWPTTLRQLQTPQINHLYSIAIGRWWPYFFTRTNTDSQTVINERFLLNLSLTSWNRQKDNSLDGAHKFKQSFTQALVAAFDSPKNLIVHSVISFLPQLALQANWGTPSEGICTWYMSVSMHYPILFMWSRAVHRAPPAVTF